MSSEIGSLYWLDFSKDWQAGSYRLENLIGEKM